MTESNKREADPSRPATANPKIGWDALSGLAPARQQPPGDFDVVWFDPARTTPEADAAAEAMLVAIHPGLPWSVRNQARMAARNGHPPYTSTLDAIAHWPEAATVAAARWTPAGGVEIAAPWGLADLLARVVRPTPRFAAGRGLRSSPPAPPPRAGRAAGPA